MLDELTAVGVKRVLGLRDREVALSDAVLAVIELTDDAVGAVFGCTISGEGEFAVSGQQEIRVVE
jgi:hypothetical protein